jgi:transcriptional/translational regulatory protein YebC/TACO1
VFVRFTTLPHRVARRFVRTRNGGTMADPGSVSYLFSRKGVVTLEKNGPTEDDVLTAVLEAGAEDQADQVVEDVGLSRRCDPQRP